MSVAGGLFAQGILIGASYGRMIGSLFGYIDESTYALLGAASFLGKAKVALDISNTQFLNLCASLLSKVLGAFGTYNTQQLHLCAGNTFKKP